MGTTKERSITPGLRWRRRPIPRMLQVFLAFLILSLSNAEDPPDIDQLAVSCLPNSMDVVITLRSPFSGVIYPKGLFTNSSCLVQYDETYDKITYSLPLDSCNTMNTDAENGVEYYNVIVVQPNHFVVTTNSRTFDIRCLYKPEVSGGAGPVPSNHGKFKAVTPQAMVQQLPRAMMHIYRGDGQNHVVADNVKIGDDITMAVSIDKQDMYGLKVTDCVVKDGLNWSEQILINADGCPIDSEIMNQLQYDMQKKEAWVKFKAHKFPYTSSVYYRCNIQLCKLSQGNCENVPPRCTRKNKHSRIKRNSEVDGEGNLIRSDLVQPVTSALHVNDNTNSASDTDLAEEPLDHEHDHPEDAYCLSLTTLAIVLAIAGVILIICVILLVLFLVQKRRRRKGPTTSADSSIYSGPYSNQAYTS